MALETVDLAQVPLRLGTIVLLLEALAPRYALPAQGPSAGQIAVDFRGDKTGRGPCVLTVVLGSGVAGVVWGLPSILCSQVAVGLS